jgi:hypothetical protein
MVHIITCLLGHSGGKIISTYCVFLQKWPEIRIGAANKIGSHMLKATKFGVTKLEMSTFKTSNLTRTKTPLKYGSQILM